MVNTASNLTITAFILAGGKSRRLGQDKALLTINKQPLLQRICLMAQTITELVYVVTPWPEKYLGILPPGCGYFTEVVTEGSGGPLAGFAQALEGVTTEWVLLLACDLPYLEASYLAKGRELLPELSAEVIALLPKQEKGWEPLVGFYRSSCVNSLAVYRQGGGQSFQNWLAQEKVATLPLPNPRVVFNCNTPEDWAAVANTAL